MSRLELFDALACEPLAQNRELFAWLGDDAERVALYGELRDRGFPDLTFKSIRRLAGNAEWPTETVVLVTHPARVLESLARDSVEPYASLESGGRFMLGIDDPIPHDRQRGHAARALKYTAAELGATARLAVRRALVAAKNDQRFDLVVDVAKPAAVHYAELLFGMPRVEHVLLAGSMDSIYTHLSFQIVGRHFVCDTGLPPRDDPDVRNAGAELKVAVRNAAKETSEKLRAFGLPQEPVIQRLRSVYAGDELAYVALGLIAGTIGNVAAAIAIALDHFFRTGMIDAARRAARALDDVAFVRMIEAAHREHPPAPFLTRIERPGGRLLLLALGAVGDDRLRFGGPWGHPAYAHQCVGQALVKPIVVEAVREVLRLPGLARDIDPATGTATKLEKRWGAMCTSFPLHFQRDRASNQRPLHVVLPIKEPFAENAQKLRVLTRAGANIVDEALRDSLHVHFAWFDVSADNRHLTMCTVYDGDFDTYVAYFALDVPLFDKQFDYLDVVLPRPIRDFPKQFVDVIRTHNRIPAAHYFFSAYAATTADIQAADLDRP